MNKPDLAARKAACLFPDSSRVGMVFDREFQGQLEPLLGVWSRIHRNGWVSVSTTSTSKGPLPNHGKQRQQTRLFVSIGRGLDQKKQIVVKRTCKP